MTYTLPQQNAATISTLNDLAPLANYSLVDTLNCDPDATQNGVDHGPRQVFSGHYVPVNPTPIQDPEYVAHSQTFFSELGFSDNMAQSADFMRLFSGDTSQVPPPMRKTGWATGYALSIYGTEYIQQCPFQTGNGYGDGRAISVLEAVINGKRWEMQLKGGGQTPYCRGADGRAVLRSSIREFLAQEHMHALGVPTSRSLSLYVSKTETVQRPWYSPGSLSHNPDRYIYEPTAISTRVAPSFLRVGQLELFARRARVNQHPKALEELEKIVLHAIDREYPDVIDTLLPTPDKVVLLAREFQGRLASLVANWIRVGFCQGNFNSDNCAVGGFTLDYGPFGFCDMFQPYYQPWTGGGRHFSFMNQPNAAQKNFEMFCSALRPLLAAHQDHLRALDQVQNEFPKVMNKQMKTIWAAKLGLSILAEDVDNTEADEAAFNTLLSELLTLMQQTPVDYTIFFRELSSIPKDISPLQKSFYQNIPQNTANDADPALWDKHWTQWLENWKTLLFSASNNNATLPRSSDEISKQMKKVNPKYILREWFVAPAYQQASSGDYTLVQELQAVMTQPYEEQSKLVEDKYYRLKPAEYFEVGGVSHLSCSS
ncbi:protein adenylyltransferase SelO family protein [uncultured Paraglaciecola sp.]|uniref:protein adenylyltransferase SelO n=1 Tax=uncultured Paraglaciecola sp. TaxID=1765024 RepID=UPI0030D946F8|tara:strand:- start:15936 stop:17729 length:1794 start_codon:yes stop_codon:yes gene_type:complete